VYTTNCRTGPDIELLTPELIGRTSRLGAHLFRNVLYMFPESLQKLLPAATSISEFVPITNHKTPQVHGTRVRIKRKADGQIRRVFVRRSAPGAHHRAEARGRVSAPGRRELG
jgi:hypothetical protein